MNLSDTSSIFIALLYLALIGPPAPALRNQYVNKPTYFVNVAEQCCITHNHILIPTKRVGSTAISIS